jgi:hypothetical protein
MLTSTQATQKCQSRDYHSGMALPDAMPFDNGVLRVGRHALLDDHAAQFCFQKTQQVLPVSTFDQGRCSLG